MNILVFGGTKFTGQAIVRKLLNRGDRVTLFTRGNFCPDFISDITHITGNRNNYELLYQLFHKSEYDVVIDMLAFTAEDVESIYRAFGNRIGHYIVTSTENVYFTKHRGFSLYNEDEVETDVSNNDTYGSGKRAMEQWLKCNVESTGMAPYTVFYYGVIEGILDPSKRTWYWVQRLLDGGDILFPIFSPVTLWRLVHCDDAADAYLAAIANPIAFNRSYNLCSEEILTVSDYIELLAGITGSSSQIVYATKEQLQQLPSVLEFYSTHTRQRYTMDSTRAYQELAWNPRPIAVWAKEMTDYYMNTLDLVSSYGYEYRSDEIALARELKNLNPFIKETATQ